MKLSLARREALGVLTRARTREAWGPDLLSATLSASQLDDRDFAFVTRLVYGVISAEGTLDEALDRHITRPSRVHPRVRDALRLSAYELLFMRTPPVAAVHQGVEAVRSVEPRATGLANAVLRALADEADAFPWGDVEHDLEALARATAHPLWLVELLIKELGDSAARLMLYADNAPAPLYLAHNPFAGSLEDLVCVLDAEGAKPAPEGPPGCIRANAPSAAVRGGALREGLCVVADAAAQYCATLAAPGPGRAAVELAAGRGTKTLIMQGASLALGGAGTVLGADIHAFKASLLEERMQRLSVPGVTAVVADTSDPDCVTVLGGPLSADIVMIDAPCSGLGTLRRHPEKRWRLNAASIAEMAVVGEGMLRTAARLVRPGGFVVYSTCTVTERENRKAIEDFLATTTGSAFRVSPLRTAVPGGWEHCVTPEGWFQSLPRPDGPDGHFAAVLQAF